MRTTPTQPKNFHHRDTYLLDNHADRVPSKPVNRQKGSHMARHTKIVATLGPASKDPQVLETLIRSGVDVVRLNFSHGKAEDHINLASEVRRIAARLGRSVGILADLQGPKIRVGKFEQGKVQLVNGADFVLDASRTEPGDERGVGLDYKELPRDVKTGDTLLLNDGLIVLTVTAVRGDAVHTVVKVGGELSNNKGINKQGGGLSAPALTAKDMEDIKTAMGFQADYVAVSFPKTATDMEMARQLCIVAGSPWRHRPGLIAKIERAEAIPHLEDILRASDGIMVARGDLAVEVGNAAVPALQKKMITMARSMDKVVITATQMMESMITNPVPTRAEVSDVANAVLDGTDAVMLSAETAAGKYPLETVREMANICAAAEAAEVRHRSRKGSSKPAEHEAPEDPELLAKQKEEKLNALIEKGKQQQLVDALSQEFTAVEEGIAKLTAEIELLEAKLEDARGRQKAMLLRSAAAQSRLNVQQHGQRATPHSIMEKFDRMERKIEEMESKVCTFVHKLLFRTGKIDVLTWFRFRLRRILIILTGCKDTE